MAIEISGREQREAEYMFEILNFARLHGRKIDKKEFQERFGNKTENILQKLLQRELLREVKKGDLLFYAITSNGLNLFEDKRRAEPVPEELKSKIIEKLDTYITELEMKPWELMFHIIRVIGDRKSVTTDEVIHYFKERFSDVRGTSRPNVYRNLKRLRMKDYIEYEKQLYGDQSSYRLSEKGKEIFGMTRADATSRLRTSEEWDRALVEVFQRVDEERKKTDEALFYFLDNVLPNIDKNQLIWVLYTYGGIHELKGNLDKAEEVYLRMVGICEDVKDKKGRAYALKGLGNVTFKQGKHPVANQYYTRCRKIAQELQDNNLLSDVLNNLGSCLYMDDDVDEALTLLEEALTLAGNDTTRKASTLYNQGLCYARKEDYTRAKELWSESLDLYEELHENIEIKKVQHNLREIDRRQKREHLEDSFRQATRTGTSDDITKAYKELNRFLMDDLKGAEAGE